ncbi:MAG: DUF3990 domain-containing protein [Clostridium sp.]
MLVYHGSYCIVEEPTVLFSRDALDFGKGFYVTNIEEQAVKWSERFKVNFGKAYVNKYELDLNSIKKDYKVKEFKYYDDEWLDFILECRSGSDIFNEYDILIGGIADDRVYNTIELFQDKLISKEEALKRLKFYRPNNQICIVNQNIISKYLRYCGVSEV